MGCFRPRPFERFRCHWFLGPVESSSNWVCHWPKRNIHDLMFFGLKVSVRWLTALTHHLSKNPWFSGVFLNSWIRNQVKSWPTLFPIENETDTIRKKEKDSSRMKQIHHRKQWESTWLTGMKPQSLDSGSFSRPSAPGPSLHIWIEISLDWKVSGLPSCSDSLWYCDKMLSKEPDKHLEDLRDAWFGEELSKMVLVPLTTTFFHPEKLSLPTWLDFHSMPLLSSKCETTDSRRSTTSAFWELSDCMWPHPAHL